MADIDHARDVQLLLTALLDDGCDVDEQEVIDAVGRLADTSHQTLCLGADLPCELWTADTTYAALVGDSHFRPVITLNVTSGVL
jgi:hypothetical protein